MSGNGQHAPQGHDRSGKDQHPSDHGQHKGDNTIKVTVDSLAIRVKPIFTGSSHHIDGARIAIVTTAPVTVAGQQLPADTKVLHGGVQITQGGDLRVMATELLGSHVHDHLLLSGNAASAIIGDLQNTFAPGGSPLMLASDVLSALASAAGNSGHGHHG
jgi:hypothetical protein